ncbi:MAG: alpha/beta hydrolase [Myxococcota bacterium]
MALDPQLGAMLALSQPIRRSPADQTPKRARAETEWQARLVRGAPPACLHVDEGSFPGPTGRIRYRRYVPRHASSPLPLLVYYHGGGFVIGSLDSHDDGCRLLAVEGDCVVVSIDYRLAPEHPFPAAVHDAVAAYVWARTRARELQADPERVVVGGDSAGGNLSAEVCLEMKRHGERTPELQLLIYPATDLTRSCPSHRTFSEGYFLDDETMEWFLANYLPRPEDARDPLASPLFVEDLSGLPPAHVVTAGFDPLRDEGEAYAERLRDAGVPVELQREEPLIHGFFNMGGVSRAAESASRSIARHLRSALHR